MNRSNYDIVRIDALQKRIENGVVFEVASAQDVANTPARVEWVFRTGKKRVFVHERLVTSNGDELTYQVFKSPTLSDDGISLNVTNRKGADGLNPTVSIFEAPTVTDDGDPLQPVYMPGTSGVGNSTSGQFSREGQVRVLDPDTDYLCTVTNAGSINPATVEWYVMWAELEEPA